MPSGDTSSERLLAAVPTVAITLPGITIVCAHCPLHPISNVRRYRSDQVLREYLAAGSWLQRPFASRQTRVCQTPWSQVHQV